MIEARRARLNINLRPSLMDAIKEAADMRGQTITVFVERACLAQLDQSEFILINRDDG